MTLTERVARAILESFGFDPREEVYLGSGESEARLSLVMRHNVPSVLAAINSSGSHVVAPVEATEEMIAVGWVSGPRFAYLAMIQAIPKVTP